jgi:hypothetical protein
VEGLGGGVVLKAVQGGADGGSGPRGQYRPGACRCGELVDVFGAGVCGAGGCKSCGEVFVCRRNPVPGERGFGQDGMGEVEPPFGFAEPDPQPDSQELGGSFATVIGRRGGDRYGGSRQGGADGGPRCVGFIQGYGAVIPACNPGPGSPGCCGGMMAWVRVRSTVPAARIWR